VTKKNLCRTNISREIEQTCIAVSNTARELKIRVQAPSVRQAPQKEKFLGNVFSNQFYELQRVAKALSHSAKPSEHSLLDDNKASGPECQI
jgi:hypothetical protein